MAGNWKALFRLWGVYARLDLHWLTQDTKYCVLTIFSDLLSNLSSVLGVFLLAVRFGGVGGLSADEVLFMLGFYNIVSGLFNLFFLGNNVGNISRRIGRGQLDHMLIQPLPLTVQLLSEGFLPFSGSGVLLGGIAVTVIAAVRLSLPFSLPWLGLLLLMAFSALFIWVGLAYLVSVSAFYHPAGSEEISSVAIDALATLGGYPLGGLSGWLQALLVVVFPAGCLAWLPAMILLGRSPFGAAALLPLLAFFICGIAAVLFQKGMKHYGKFGSQRYRSMGHRS